MEIKINKLHKAAILPFRANKSDAGYDLCSVKDMVIGPMERAIVPTGISIEIPEGYYGRVAPRSGLAVKKFIDVLAGVVDSGYRGEIGVVLVNLNLPEVLFNPSRKTTAFESAFGSKNKFSISRGDKIAQLIIEKCHDIQWKEASLSGTERGDKGYGSSDIIQPID
jgi:dUTP pyrophosphatase